MRRCAAFLVSGRRASKRTPANANEQQRTTTPIGVRCRSLAIAQVGSEPFPCAIRILPEAAVVRSLIAAEAALPH